MGRSSAPFEPAGQEPPPPDVNRYLIEHHIEECDCTQRGMLLHVGKYACGPNEYEVFCSAACATRYFQQEMPQNAHFVMAKPTQRVMASHVR